MVEGSSIQYKWQVLFKIISRGECSMDVIREYLGELRLHSGYKLCPGVKEYPEEVRFETKKVRQWGLPFNRIDCESCTLWHMEACKPCRLLHRDITKLVKKATCATSEQQLARVSVHSNYPLKYLSPTTRRSECPNCPNCPWYERI